MASINYSTAQSRSEQMKRELIGLVIGTSLLMAGMAFLFSQTIVADSPVGTASADKSETVAAVAVAPAATETPVAADVSASSPAAVTLASRDVVTNNAANTAVAPASATAAPVTAPVDSTLPVQADVTATTIPVAAETTPATDATATPAAEEQPGRTGWIYAGQFANGKWSEQGLKVGAELPASGSRYALTWGATVRDMPPGKRSSGGKLGKTVGNLASGQEVEIVQVKKSGRQGHVWVEVKL